MILKFRHLIITAIILLTLILMLIPKVVFNDPESDILYSSEGKLLNARIADDGQWRFPESDSVPYKFKEALLTFEDKRFYYHPGIDILALLRAIKININNQRVSSGGSTITMQLVRMSRKNKPRTYNEKFIEVFIALRSELSYSKEKILSLYASHAPFGGNIVGLDAASWRYFGHPSADLSWAESALMAVLPNSPSMLHPGKNRDKLLNKRNKLLSRLKEKGIIDNDTYSLSIDEPLPEKPTTLPSLALHLMNKNIKEGNRGNINTTIKYNLQVQSKFIATNYIERYKHNHINNIAILVADVKSGEILSYIGNGDPDNIYENGRMVDMISAKRSPGSLLKPFLYACMLEEGQILPNSLMPDIPVYLKGFIPQNYNRTFQGAVPAQEAISRSLNVPLVRMLLNYDYNRFYDKLKSFGMNTLNRDASHYGASIILGGAEGTLLNLTSMYASLARILQSESYLNKHYSQLYYSPKHRISDEDTVNENPPLHKDAIWYTVEAMTKLNRHEEEMEWNNFSSMKKVAWKTGTSYGHRDAWAIGFTKNYIVGIWVGNASGEGRPGMTGVNYAAPVLFDVLSLLPASEWFDMPLEEMTDIEICTITGFRAGKYCDDKYVEAMPSNAKNVEICPYHKKIFLDPSGKYLANADCFASSELIEQHRMILPPAMEWYYMQCRAEYHSLPTLHPSCAAEQDKIEIIYPAGGADIYIPIGFKGNKEKIVLKAAHSRKDATLYWYLDSEYLGCTNDFHDMALSPKEGKYCITITDDKGISKSFGIRIYER